MLSNFFWCISYSNVKFRMPKITNWNAFISAHSNSLEIECKSNVFFSFASNLHCLNRNNTQFVCESRNFEYRPKAASLCNIAQIWLWNYYLDNKQKRSHALATKIISSSIVNYSIAKICMLTDRLLQTD